MAAWQTVSALDKVKERGTFSCSVTTLNNQGLCWDFSQVAQFPSLIVIPEKVLAAHNYPDNAANSNLIRETAYSLWTTVTGLGDSSLQLQSCLGSLVPCAPETKLWKGCLAHNALGKVWIKFLHRTKNRTLWAPFLLGKKVWTKKCFSWYYLMCFSV